VLAWLESTQFSAWVRGDSLWGWPFVLTVHVLGTSVVIGFIFIVNLRLLGLFETIPYASLKRLFPVIWVAFALQLLSGVALWMTKPTRYVADAAFVLKILLVILGVGLMLSVYDAIKREAASWDTARTVSPLRVKFIAANLLVWCGVVIAGRLTAYLGSIYPG
jgi:hypothetical protein